MSDFAWLIEAPGARYLGTREIGHYPDFFWTADPHRATRFFSKEQADGVMSAVRRMRPDLFAFAVNLGEPAIHEHKWISTPLPARPDQSGSDLTRGGCCAVCGTTWAAGEDLPCPTCQDAAAKSEGA